MNRKLFLMGVLAPVLALVLSATLSARPDADPSPALVTDRPLSPPTSTPAPGIWIPTGSLNTARKWHTATLLQDGRVLVAGGCAQGYVACLLLPTSAELYDPATGTWSTTGSLNTARAEHAATLLQDGRVLVAGGCNGRYCYTLASAELYDPATGTWSTTGNLNSARSHYTATVLPDGRVLVAGGYSIYAGYLASAELYDPLTGTWTPTGSLNTARTNHTATLLNNGKVLVAGGYNPNYYNLASAELYDPATGTWSTTGSLNTGRERHTATLLNDGRVLVAGLGNDAELYDPATGTWSTTGSMNTARYGHFTATLLQNGQALVAGPGDSAELYDPVTGTWAFTGSLNTGRQWHTATLLNDGRVLVAGGWGSTYPYDLASAELYITLLNGRMNGGGSILTSGSRVAHDFDLLCNVTQAPNSLEVTWGVTWGQVNQFHLESLTMAVCTDDPAIVPDPPAAPFDTYQGAGTGRYNGVSGATIEFTFTDAGEPGENDFAEIVIRDAGGSIVLSLSGTLRSGNHQALKE